MGIGIYISTKRRYRRGEEHGSAKWGDAMHINKKYSVKKYEANKLMTQNVRISYNSRKHRRNLFNNSAASTDESTPPERANKTFLSPT